MQFDIITMLVGLMATIMLAGVPWAYRIGERISSIETKVKMIQVVEERDIKEVLKGIEALQARWTDSLKGKD